MRLTRFLSMLVCLTGLALPVAPSQADTPRVSTPDGTEISLQTFAAEGDRLFIWLPPEAGFGRAQPAVATRLAAAGTEVWLADLLESRFLPTVPSSLDRIPAEDVAALIQAGAARKPAVYLLTSGRGVLPALRGAHRWQRTHPADNRFKGLIVLSPKFYLATPQPGEAGQLLPIVSQSNLPVFILQPQLSPWYWKLPATVPALQQGGSDVFVRILPGVRDRFYYRPDASPAEQQLARRLPTLLDQAARLLASLPPGPRKVAPLIDRTASLPGKQDRSLRPYRGESAPPPLDLPDLAGRRHRLADYHGQVVLVNFWASWCPPCVHEMPSMQRLTERLADQPFTILGVNMAEDPATIRRFLDTRVRVTFPILLDRDGRALGAWGVYAFPTSFVLDKQGHIRYALFGSIEWDTPEVLAVLQGLLEEPAP
jgi:peroxiredoxin